MWREGSPEGLRLCRPWRRRTGSTEEPDELAVAVVDELSEQIASGCSRSRMVQGSFEQIRKDGFVVEEEVSLVWGGGGGRVGLGGWRGVERGEYGGVC